MSLIRQVLSIAKPKSNGAGKATKTVWSPLEKGKLGLFFLLSNPDCKSFAFIKINKELTHNLWHACWNCNWDCLIFVVDSPGKERLCLHLASVGVFCECEICVCVCVLTSVVSWMKEWWTFHWQEMKWKVWWHMVWTFYNLHHKNWISPLRLFQHMNSKENLSGEI